MNVVIINTNYQYKIHVWIQAHMHTSMYTRACAHTHTQITEWRYGKEIPGFINTVGNTANGKNNGIFLFNAAC